MNGELGILNVGAGDIKLSFDPANPAERIRSARIVTDMLRRGYALLVEVDDGKGGSAFQRATAFREETCEYIIADLDPEQAARADSEEASAQGRPSKERQEEPEPAAPREAGTPKRGRRGRTTAVPATSTRGVAVARSAGG